VHTLVFTNSFTALNWWC